VKIKISYTLEAPPAARRAVRHEDSYSDRLEADGVDLVRWYILRATEAQDILLKKHAACCGGADLDFAEVQKLSTLLMEPCRRKGSP